MIMIIRMCFKNIGVDSDLLLLKLTYLGHVEFK